MRFFFKGDQKLRDLLKLAPSHYRSMAGQLVCIGYPETSLGVSKNRGFSPQIIHFNRVFHDFHHPFWDTLIFGNTLMAILGFSYLTHEVPPEKNCDLLQVAELEDDTDDEAKGCHQCVFFWCLDILWVVPPTQ